MASLRIVRPKPEMLQEEDQFYTMPESHHKSIVRIPYGCLEKSPMRKRDQFEEQYQKRVTIAKERRMADNCDEMFLRLQQSGYLRSVKSREYEEEDHGSVIAAALNGAIFYFLDHLRRL